MVSTLEKNVVSKIKAIKTKAQKEADEVVRKEREFQAKLPQTPEERAKIVWPSITDGKWKYQFKGGNEELHFWVQGIDFNIHPVYIPADSGTPTEGYMGSDAHWENYLHVSPPNDFTFCLGYVGDLDNSWLVRGGEDEAWYNEEKAKLIKALNDNLAELVQSFLLNKDDFQHMEDMRRRVRNRR